jgi:hypothetical protein
VSIELLASIEEWRPSSGRSTRPRSPRRRASQCLDAATENLQLVLEHHWWTARGVAFAGAGGGSGARQLAITAKIGRSQLAPLRGGQGPDPRAGAWMKRRYTEA